MFCVKFAENEMNFDAPLSVFDAAKAAELVTRAHIAARVNGVVVDMTRLIDADATVELGKDPATWFGTPTLSEAGTVTAQPIGDVTLPGTKVRTVFGLRSATFTVTYHAGQFTFAVRGYGHGVGMSQHGADYLARQGYTYPQILAHYYVGTKVEQEYK